MPPMILEEMPASIAEALRDKRKIASASRRPGVVGVAISALAFLLSGALAAAPDPRPSPWRQVLAFEVTDTAPTHQANLDKRRVIVADRDDPGGWDIGVYLAPRDAQSPNLLYGGHNWHGPQPWHVYAQTRQDGLFEDLRVVEYGSPRRRLKIILKDCETADADGSAVFTKGRVEVWAQP